MVFFSLTYLIDFKFIVLYTLFSIGPLPSDIGKLSELKYFDAQFNYFTSSSIPISIGMLQNLEYLNIADTYLSGNIPSEIGMLSLLSSLHLESNELSGMFLFNKMSTHR